MSMCPRSLFCAACREGLKRADNRGSKRVLHLVCMLSCVQLFVTPWTVAGQAPLSM